MGSSYLRYDKADIYDATTNTWTSQALVGRNGSTTLGMAATVINDTIYFAGGMSSNQPYDYAEVYLTSTINIYDAANNTWSTSALSQPRGFLAGIAIDNKNYWAGGITTTAQSYPYNEYTDLVEIRDMNSGASSTSCLFQKNGFFSAVKKDTKIVFFTGAIGTTNKFDIYDYASNSWAVGVLPVRILDASVIAANNTIYVAGGYIDLGPSNTVYKLEFNTPLPLTVVHLSASALQNEVDVKWQTENEVNTASFDVERSADAVHFSSLGSVSATRNGRRSEYTYQDRSPLKGLNYYRLKMIDADNKFSYSNVVAVKRNSNSSLQLFPNPATSTLFVQASGANEKATLQIIDAAGRKLKEEKLLLSGSTSYAIDISDLRKGVYYLLLTSELKTQQMKFVKL
ncbi:MAG: T9SS type A sorting domain-containing protein [Ferruginibacter sp.]